MATGVRRVLSFPAVGILQELAIGMNEKQVAFTPYCAFSMCRHAGSPVQ